MSRTPADLPVILLTGFDAFATFATNPSWDALARARDLGLFEGIGARVEILRLPVVFGAAFDVLAARVEDLHPIAAMSFGVHFGGDTRYRDGVFYPESVAHNRDGPTRPDNAGITRPLQPIVDGGPEIIASPLPAAFVAERLRAAGFAADVCDNAGEYLCNHIFYTGSYAFGSRFPFGFVHVPPTTDVGGTVAPDDLARAMAVMAESALVAATAM